MTHLLKCPSCEKPFQVLAEQAGAKVKCPTCLKVVGVPKNIVELTEKRKKKGEPDGAKIEAPTVGRKKQTRKPIEKHSDISPSQNQQKTKSDARVNVGKSRVESAAKPMEAFACPKCAAPFKITEEMFGRKVSCPKCKSVTRIPKHPSEKRDGPVPENRSGGTREPSVAKSSGRMATDSSRSSSGTEKKPKQLSQPISKDGSAPTAPRKSSKSKPKKDSKNQDSKNRTQTGGADPPTTKRAKSKGAGPKLEGAERPVKVSRRRWKSDEEVSPDLFAPGHSKAEKDASSSEPAKKTTRPAGARRQSSASQLLDEEPKPSFEPKAVDHLLPPRFDVVDPAALAVKVRDDDNKVYLPDGKGGVQRIDNRIVTLEYGGEKVRVTAPSDADKKRRRLITNIIVLVVLLSILGSVFYLLLQYM